MRPGRPTMAVDPSLPDYPTLIHALDAAAEIAPERTALVCGEASLSYAEYRRAVAGLALRLIEGGARGGRLAIMMGNSLEMSVACLGGMAAGAQIAPFNPAYTDHEIAPLMADVQPAVIVCEARLAERARAHARATGAGEVLVLGPGGLDIGAWAGDAGLRLPQPLPRPDDPAAMFFTGGTTGVPKGAEHVHSMLIAFCRLMITQWRLDLDTERILTVAPLFHIWGHHFANVAPLYLRASLVMTAAFKPEAVLELFERHRITVFAGGPPALYFGLLANPRVETTDFSSLKYCLGGGAPCPAELLKRWEEKTGCALLEGSGMSEGAPISGNPTHGRRKPGSAGIVPPETEIDIVDVATGTRVLGPGERGEVRVRGPQFTRSYRNRPEETANAIRDGRLHTGDIGYLDDDGYLFLVDRKKEMILVGGYSVYPREIDEVLHAHPAVHEAAAVGVPDEFRGEVVKAFVALKPGESLTEDALIAWCAERLVKYKLPVAVEFLEALPKTGANKIDKLALKGQRRLPDEA